MLTVEDGISYLRASGAKVTATRIAILRSLEGRHDHPSAEQLFIELKPHHPTLSIATVYSTAALLARGSMIRVLSIDEKRVCYDPNTEPHGHFLCTTCHRVFDVPVRFNMMKVVASNEEIAAVDDAELFFYGACAKCA
jgi:Fur family peroxide stress response transcriptional regulator